MPPEMIEALGMIDEELLLADGFDDALIGYVDAWLPVSGGGATRGNAALYDREKCIDILVKRDGMTWEEAEEFFDFNVAGAYVGEKTPVFASILKL